MNKYQSIISKLEKIGIVFDSKLSDSEIIKIEKLYGIYFPSELKHLFSIALPISDGFYNWRDTSEDNIKKIKKALESSITGLQSDLDNNDFWCEDWGDKPIDINVAQNILLQHYSKAPILIPIFSHRYIPFVGQFMTSPVFSIYGSDIIYYGENLISYLEVEFGFRKYAEMDTSELTHIDFWSDIM